MEDSPKISVGPDLPTMSSLVAARRSLISEDCREKSETLQQEVPKVIGRFPRSFKETSDSIRKQDHHVHTQSVSGHQNEDERNSNKDPILLSFGSKGNHIHYSGPLLAPAGKVDQMLKDHDRHIQEAARRARLDKTKLRRVQAEGNQLIPIHYSYLVEELLSKSSPKNIKKKDFCRKLAGDSFEN